jgi:crotonobetainyl-CoA:carnitine CoA-transferase CaiB-like acyl-CoA transferase
VLDLTRVRSGPTCVRQLADWGANVIKIEMPPGAARARTKRRAARARADFQNLHRNKRSMTLNLKSPRASRCLKRWSRRPTSSSRTSAPT